MATTESARLAALLTAQSSDPPSLGSACRSSSSILTLIRSREEDRSGMP
jgi:hypothetical protein